MIVKNFYEIMNRIHKRRNDFLDLNGYRILIRIIRVLLPLYYTVTKKRIGVSEEKDNNSPKIVLSLTTFPPRMKRIWVVIESLLRQTHKPDHIILWLASSQFPKLKDINGKVLKMQDRGLEIRFCEDIKSHKKYFYAMKEHQNDIVITVDDDIYQPEDLIENLIKKHKSHPYSVICYRAHRITFSEGQIKKYSEWDHLSRGLIGPDLLLIPTNGAGALYPPNSLDREVFNLNAIKKLSPNADDIWLKCMGYVKGTTVVKVFRNSTRLFTTKGAGETGLAKLNVDNGENDIQLKNVINYYNIDFLKTDD